MTKTLPSIKILTQWIMKGWPEVIDLDGVRYVKEAKLEAMERLESSLATLADCINLELRESGEFVFQIKDYLAEDMRPFIRRLVDANRGPVATQPEEQGE